MKSMCLDFRYLFMGFASLYDTCRDPPLRMILGYSQDFFSHAYIATAMYIYPTDYRKDAADSGFSVDLLLILTIAFRTGIGLERF